MHFDGVQWNQLDTGTNQPIFRDMWGTSSSNVFIAGSERIPRLVGVMLRYDGVEFTRMEFFEQTYWGVWGTSENDAIAVGQRGLIAHYDGTKWTRMESGTTDDLICVWGDAPDRYFAGSSRGHLYAYDGESWRLVELGIRSPVYGLWGSGGKVYASVIQDVLRLEGGQWKPLRLPDRQSYLSTCGHPDVGLYVTGRSGLVLFSAEAP